MLKTLTKFESEAYALLRIVSGFMLSGHGIQKILGWTSDRPVVDFGSQMWVGGMIEMFGGLAVMLGYQTRLAAFLCSGTMAVAYTQFHWKFQGGRDFFPFVNRGETALLYSFVFLLIACKGAGKWSLKRDA
jgi:putative oxidoreductase